MVDIYSCTRSFPKEEMYALVGQLRRAAVSVPSNIAEGKDRRTAKEFLQFLHHARGSVFEVEAQLTIAGLLTSLRLKAAGWEFRGRSGPEVERPDQGNRL